MVDDCEPNHAVDILQLLEMSWMGPRHGPRRNMRPVEDTPETSRSPPRKPAPSPRTPSDTPVLSNSFSAWPVLVHGCGGAQPMEYEATGSPGQQLPGIGTWAGRQRLFMQQGSLQPAPDAVGCSSPALQLQPPGPLHIGSGGGTPAGSSLQSEQEREAAWRWRFSRKWFAERKNCGQPEEPSSVLSADGMDALQYTQACGMGENLQFEPLPQSMASQQGGLVHSMSCQFDVSSHGGSLAQKELAAATDMLEQEGATGWSCGTPGRPARHGRVRGAPWLHADEDATPATNVVLSMATKARDLLEKQKQLEQEAQSRWERSMSAGASSAWAGQQLQAVRIGMSGSFLFVLVRASDPQGHQRFLVRGRGQATPAALLEDACKEAAAASKRGGLRLPTLEVVAVGMMEWRQDTDRHLHLSASSVSGDLLPMSTLRTTSSTSVSPKLGPMLGDATGLAASLVRQELPCHFHVSTSTASGRRASFMESLNI